MMYDTLIERCPLHILTDNLEYEEWLEKRRGSIGGSDAGPIMGYSDYASRLTLYLQKKGMAESREMSRAAQRGKLLEPLVRDWFAQSYPEIMVSKVPYMFYSPDYPFMSANTDGLLFLEEGRMVTIGDKKIAGLGGLEIKSSKTGYGFGKDEIPDTYYAQVQHYMAVLDLPWFVVSTCFLETEQIEEYVIYRDKGFIADMLSQEKDFFEQYLVPGVMPAAIGIDNEEAMITGIFEGTKSTIMLSQSEVEWCQEYTTLARQIKELETKKGALATDLKARLVSRSLSGGDERKLSAYGGPYVVSWSRYDTTRIDTDALKKAGLYERYSKKIESGRFTVTEKKRA
ncbi:MAG: YqaJ viral recombinase family protein [Treponema sp.]|nr:YqaJ viral recombinase family protein [Treponema sp.]